MKSLDTTDDIVFFLLSLTGSSIVPSGNILTDNDGTTALTDNDGITPLTDN